MDSGKDALELMRERECGGTASASCAFSICKYVSYPAFCGSVEWIPVSSTEFHLNRINEVPSPQAYPKHSSPWEPLPRWAPFPHRSPLFGNEILFIPPGVSYRCFIYAIAFAYFYETSDQSQFRRHDIVFKGIHVTIVCFNET